MKNRKVAAGLALAGAVTVPGMHRFYLGQSRWGLAYLVLAWGTPLSRIASAIEAVWYLSMDELDFAQSFGDGSLPVQPSPGLALATQASADAALALAAALRELEQLRRDGLLTDAEFEQQRQQLSGEGQARGKARPIGSNVIDRLATALGSRPSPVQPPSLGRPIDVNQASVDDWLTLPGISIHQARAIVQISQAGVQYHALEDLAAVLGIPAAQLSGLGDRLQFCYYDGPELDRLDPNQASAAELMRLPGLDAIWADRIVQERHQGPYRTLSDLQQRIGLPGHILSHAMHGLQFGQ